MEKNDTLRLQCSSENNAGISFLGSDLVPYSVLMSVYFRERPEFLSAALDSMLQQTRKPEQIVLVEDGPLPPELKAVIESFGTRHPDLLTSVVLVQNEGLGSALAKGMLSCRNEIVARMDSDDYSFPERMEKELDVLIEEGLDFVGSQIVEFEDDPSNPIAQSTLPVDQRDIEAYSKRRNPFRHPSMVFRKSAVLMAGNYSSKYLYFEDWDLFNRMLANGCRVVNIDEPLVAMRVNNNFYARRGGVGYIRYVWKFNVGQLKSKYFTIPQFIKTTIPRIIVCCMPNALRSFVYTKLLRKGVYR
ncbi:Glycosyltransferase [Bifidobacterium italicum]|uniref:Glycosyltransferase n=1 Tax=Bifidobacterium italicum TaxID=1960968 RepID=A0A2A2EM41_9BIFI|nr:glycosyltransferase [Bifidobacterium italicum]PAU70264.1 Glycosyltransferase [Bifidobacterium italicum]